MDERDVSIILKACADKIRMLEFENRLLQERIDELTRPRETCTQD